MLLGRANSKVYFSVGLYSQMHLLVTGVLDTCAGPNVIHANALPPGCHIKPWNNSHPNIPEPGQKRRDLEGKEVKKQLCTAFIELQFVEWARTVVLSPKKDCNLRFCVYYGPINAMTIWDTYRKPRKDECIYFLEHVIRLDENKEGPAPIEEGL